MAQVTIWVPIQERADAEQGIIRRPDVPEAIPFTTREGIPADFVTETRPTPLAITHAQIVVDERDVDKCPKRVQERDVAERDRLLVRMLQECGGDYERKADAFFDSVPDIATGTETRKRMAARLLLQAVARGLRPAKAVAISERHNFKDVDPGERPRSAPGGGARGPTR